MSALASELVKEIAADSLISALEETTLPFLRS